MELKELYREADYKDNRGMLFNADCLKVMEKLEGSSVDLIVTDPPYRVTAKGCAGNSGGMLRTDLNKQGKIFACNEIDCSEYAGEFYRLLKDGGHCYVMTNHINLINMLNTFTAAGFHFVKSLIWDKGNKIMGRFYMSQFEYILFFRKGKGVQINHCGTSDILSYPNKKTKDEEGHNLHDTEKPVDLMRVLIENSSQPNEIVLEPFAGIGATCVAAKQTNRRYIGIELDSKYYNIAKSRLSDCEVNGDGIERTV